MDVKAYLRTKQKQIDDTLEQYLPHSTVPPILLHEAMRYSVFAGGKRLRPILTLMTAELLRVEEEALLFAAAAIEMIHTYSLIHDDLPAMDNDDLRRGQPTNHKVYGEDIAILAGDALLTLAFEVMTDPRHARECPPHARLQAAYELGVAAGSLGMVGGQVMDLQAEQCQISGEELAAIHTRKTGKLITAALRIGGILAGAGPEELSALTTYGRHLGQAFQIIDDILDIEGDSEALGKPIHSDLEKQKSTYPAMYGLQTSKRMAQQLTDDAKAALILFEDRAELLKQLADMMISRTY